GGGFLTACELYDPNAATFSPTASLAIGRDAYVGLKLQSGAVLAAGGFGLPAGGTELASAELYELQAQGTACASGAVCTGGFCCGTACNLPNAVSSCATGTCLLVSCLGLFANCDGSDSTGCETAVDSDPSNCGGCGVLGGGNTSFICSSNHVSSATCS